MYAASLLRVLLLVGLLWSGLGTACAETLPTGLVHWADPTKGATLREVMALPPSAWTPLSEGVPRFGFSKARHWVRFQLPNPTGEELDSPFIVEVPFAYIGRLNFYRTLHGKLLSDSLSGMEVPFREREKSELRTGTFTFRIPLPRDPAETYYLAAEGDFQLALPIEVRTGREYVRVANSRQLFLGLFFGMLLFAGLFNAFLSAALRSRLYLYYCLYILGVTLLSFAHEGLSVLYFWPNAPAWATREMHVSGGIAVIFYTLFVRRFLGSALNTPRLDGLFLLTAAVSTIRSVWLMFEPSRFVMEVGEGAILVNSAIALLMAAACWRRGVNSAKLFFLSSFAFNASVILFILIYAGLLRLPGPVDRLVHFGVLLEVLLLSFALADRIRETNRELRRTNDRLGEAMDQRLRAEGALEEERRASLQAEKLSALGRMAAGIAHEINNPLAIIHGNAVLLRDLAGQAPADAARVRGIAETIEQTARRISRIVKSMRALSRDAQRDPFTRVPLVSILQDTSALARDRFRQAGIRLEFPVVDPGLSLHCRSGEIAQVLVNLLNNAFDAVEGTPDPWVRVETKADEERVELAVEDSGPGIPPEIRERIHEPFFTTKDVGRGTGLGLSISRSIVAAHGGELRIDESCPHTRFLFTIPRA